MIDVSKGRIEKYILRKAFDTPDDPYLPADILWRQKEQFSDGVGYGWIDALRDHADAQVSDHQFAVAKHRFPYNTPATKEAYYYRQIFDGIYPSLGAARTIPEGKSIACSTERALAWDASFRGRADQSGRSVGVHTAAYDASFDVDADKKKAGRDDVNAVGLEF
jgi:asparagine synthase (glutamine-hydrolysing)